MTHETSKKEESNIWMWPNDQIIWETMSIENNPFPMSQNNEIFLNGYQGAKLSVLAVLSSKFITLDMAPPMDIHKEDEKFS